MNLLDMALNNFEMGLYTLTIVFLSLDIRTNVSSNSPTSTDENFLDMFLVSADEVFLCTLRNLGNFDRMNSTSIFSYNFYKCITMSLYFSLANEISIADGNDFSAGFWERFSFQSINSTTFVGASRNLGFCFLADSFQMGSDSFLGLLIARNVCITFERRTYGDSNLVASS